MKRILITLAFLIGCSGLIFAQDVRKYPAKCISCYDADSCVFLIDLGLNISIEEHCRFFGLDAPELRTSDPEEIKRGFEARDYVRERIEGKVVILEFSKRGKFGRVLVKIWYLQDDELINLNDELIEQGLAIPYWGGKRD